MFRLIAAALLAPLVALSPAHAGDRQRLGYGHLITNDFLGDGQDRWRSGAVSSSRIWGPTWTGTAPAGFGELVELRLGMAVLAPDNLRMPAVGDRPYAGTLSAGLHTHFSRQGYDISLGGDLVFTGPNTGLGSLQRAFHDLLDTTGPSSTMLDNQIGNGVHPTFVGEVGRSVDLGHNMRLRPFVEARAGAETLLRVGADLTIGDIGQGELLIRDITTGQRYRSIQNPDLGGFSFVLGADIAHVADSIYLPENRGFVLTDRRDRLRAGVHWQGDGASVFYGVTWLGREFEAQTEGQLVGSLRVNLRF
tara:strand:+ start:82486 stop:83403 length:918 start_codon:yes stop_codon:yes gene_type:complete